MNRNEREPGRRRNVLIGIGLGLAVGVGFGLAVGQLVLGIGMWLALGAAIGARWDQRVNLMQFPPAAVRKMAIAIAVFVVALSVTVGVLDPEWSRMAQVGLVLLPGLAAVWVAMAIGSAMRQLDELQRRIQLEAISFSFAGTLVVTLVYGLLNWVGVPALNWGLVPLLMLLLWLVAKLWKMGRYR